MAAPLLPAHLLCVVSVCKLPSHGAVLASKGMQMKDSYAVGTSNFCCVIVEAFFSSASLKEVTYLASHDKF